jgi:hypothetical protein
MAALLTGQSEHLLAGSTQNDLQTEPREPEPLQESGIRGPLNHQLSPRGANIPSEVTLNTLNNSKDVSQNWEVPSATGPFTPWASIPNNMQLESRTQLTERTSHQDGPSKISAPYRHLSSLQSPISLGQGQISPHVPLEYLRIPPELEAATPKPAAFQSPCTSRTGVLPDPQDNSCYWLCFTASRRCCVAGLCFIPTGPGLGSCAVCSDSWPSACSTNVASYVQHLRQGSKRVCSLAHHPDTGAAQMNIPFSILV